MSDPLPSARATDGATLDTITRDIGTWMLCGTNESGFSVGGALASDELVLQLNEALGSDTRTMLHLLVQYTNDLCRDHDRSTQHDHSAQDLHIASHHAGSLLVKAIEARLRPGRLVKSQDRQRDLQATLFVLLTLVSTARFIFLDVSPTPSLRTSHQSFS